VLVRPSRTPVGKFGNLALYQPRAIFLISLMVVSDHTRQFSDEKSETVTAKNMLLSNASIKCNRPPTDSL